MTPSGVDPATIYNYIPETNRVSRVFKVAATLWLQFLLFPILNFLLFYVSTSRSVCAVTNVVVFVIPLFRVFPVMFFSYFLNLLLLFSSSSSSSVLNYKKLCDFLSVGGKYKHKVS